MHPTIPATAAATIHAYLSRLVPFGFWGGALVAHEGEVVLAEGYGLASAAQARPNTRDTAFSLSSITKPFTAAAVLALQEEGSLSVEHRVARYLPGVPPDKAGVTVHHLLTHTAGVIDMIGEDDREIERDDAVRKVLEAPLRFEPGSRYEYANAGFTLLAAIVELVVGEPYEAFLRRRLLAPAGMDATGYRLPDWAGRPLAHYHVDDQDRGTNLERTYPSWTLLGSGEMLSTVGDMNRWHRALADGVVLTEATQALMTRPFLDDYAYGWLIQETEYGRTAEHGGATTHGSCSAFRRFLDHDTVLVLYCNRVEGGDFLAGRIMDRLTTILFGGDVAMPPKVPVASVHDLEAQDGGRTLTGGGRVEIAKRHDHVRVRPLDPAAAAAMHGLDPADAAAVAGRTLEILDAARAGDLEPFIRSRPPDRPPEGALAEVRRFLDAAGDGTLTVLATQPSGFVPDAVDVVVTADAPEPALLMVWQDGTNRGVGFMPAGGHGMACVPCVPVGPQDLLGYHLWGERQVRIRLSRPGSITLAILV